MALGTDSGCINHPGFKATARCKQCGKPLCNKCILSTSNGVFCGDTCRGKYEDFAKRAKEIEVTRKPPSSHFFMKLKGFIVKLIVWIIVILAVCFVSAYFGVQIPFVSDIVDNFK